MTKDEFFTTYSGCCESDEWTATLQQAWCAMDACNLSGVVHSWSKWVSALWDEARRLGKGTDWMNQHPLNLIVADKLLQLAGEYQCGERTSWAYDWVYQRVREAAA